MASWNIMFLCSSNLFLCSSCLIFFLLNSNSSSSQRALASSCSIWRCLSSKSSCICFCWRKAENALLFAVVALSMAEIITFCLVRALLCATETEAKVDKWPLLAAEAHLSQLVAVVTNCCGLLRDAIVPNCCWLLSVSGCSGWVMIAASGLVEMIISCGGRLLLTPSSSSYSSSSSSSSSKTSDRSASVMPALWLMGSLISLAAATAGGMVGLPLQGWVRPRKKTSF